MCVCAFKIVRVRIIKKNFLELVQIIIIITNNLFYFIFLTIKLKIKQNKIKKKRSILGKLFRTHITKQNKKATHLKI